MVRLKRELNTRLASLDFAHRQLLQTYGQGNSMMEVVFQIDDILAASHVSEVSKRGKKVRDWLEL